MSTQLREILVDTDERTSPEAFVVAARLDELAQKEIAEVDDFLSTLQPMECTVLLIEACRCIDHMHVVQRLSANEKSKLSVHDFDILIRGWNVLLGKLLKRKGEFSGVPLRASTPELRQTVMGMMHFAGRYVILNRTAEMVRHGMVSAALDGSEIELKLSDRALTDHFHDQVDHQKLADLNAKLHEDYASDVNPGTTLRLRDVMANLTFPWKTSQGVMIGYTADPEIDSYFLRAVTQDAVQWQVDAGIHPQARLPGCSGETLTAVVHVLMSFSMKHIIFVEEGIKRHPGVNQHMSLTIWKTRAELLTSLSHAIGAPEEELDAALNLIMIKAGDADYFLTEQAPGIPLVIELCGGYLLTPVSGVFRNPFNGIRMLRESSSTPIQNAFREHREEWMVEDLCALFEGPRYHRIGKPVKLRRKGQVVTDLDAAILDRATGDLVLFQLKWQDFTSSSVKVQRSKAKNFRDQVQTWAQKTRSWIDEHGVPALCRALKLSSNPPPRRVLLVAIGRTNARFRSYGYSIEPDVLVLPWSQLLRLRLEIGSDQRFFDLLIEAASQEAAANVDRTPLPYVLERHGVRINFRDIWSGVKDK